MQFSDIYNEPSVQSLGFRGRGNREQFTRRSNQSRAGNSRSRTPRTRRVVGSSRPRLEACAAGAGGEPRSRETSKRSSATAGSSRRTGHHRASSRAARCPKPRAAAFRLPARGRLAGAAAAAPSSSETVMEMLRIVDDGIGKKAVALWWPRWVRHLAGGWALGPRQTPGLFCRLQLIGPQGRRVVRAA